MREKKIIVTDRFLSLPPKLSVAWKEISSLYMRGETLHVMLKGGELLILDELDDQTVDQIFHYHALYLEKRAEERHREAMNPLNQLFSSGEEGEMIAKIGFTSVDPMGMMAQHNPEQKDAPPLPVELLEKITGVIRLLNDEAEALPKPEGECRCFHCQIARALQESVPSKEESSEEEVAPQELLFSDWEVKETGDKLFSVTSKLNPDEKYSVFLGTPVGCTCGTPNCEHMIAALKS